MTPLARALRADDAASSSSEVDLLLLTTSIPGDGSSDADAVPPPQAKYRRTSSRQALDSPPRALVTVLAAVGGALLAPSPRAVEEHIERIIANDAPEARPAACLPAWLNLWGCARARCTL